MTSQGFLFAIVLASALTGAACYILCGPSKKKRAGPPGLINLGKSCFLNSILQAFAPCSSINNWLENVVNSQFNRENIGISQSKSLLVTTLNLLRFLNNRNEDNDKYVQGLASTTDVLKALYAHRWVITNDEQDAHEMFHVLTTTMEDEVRANTPIASITVNSTDTSTSGILSRCCDSLPTVSQTLGKHLHTQLPFRGLLASQLFCESCSYKSPLKFDTFDSLSLPLPTSKWPQVMLQDCLRHYLMPERVKDVECERCSQAQQQPQHGFNKTTTKSTFIKQLTIGKIPDLLCIHIQRMAWLDNGMPTKRYEHVIFPPYLNMSEFRIGYQASNKVHISKLSISSLVGGSCETHDKCRRVYTAVSRVIIQVFLLFLYANVKKKSCEENGNVGTSSSTLSSKLSHWNSGNKQPLMYSLQSVIVHLGDAHSGHFVTYRRGAIGSRQRNRWYLCSDSTVYEVSAEQVLNSDAYMLFYEKAKQLL